MHPTSKTLFVAAAIAVAVAAASIAAPAAEARDAFSGNVCSLLAAKQVAAAHAPTKCANKPPIRSAGVTTFYATWGSGFSVPNLSVEVVSYQNSLLFQRTKQSLTGRYATKLVGIGSVAYEQRTSSGATINFIVGNDLVSMHLQAAKPLSSLASFNALAKTIAGELQR